MNRYLFCPICGARVEVETDGQFPEVSPLPRHTPTGNAWPGGGVANLCQGMAVTVTLDFDKCRVCGCNISSPTGLCCECYGKESERAWKA